MKEHGVLPEIEIFDLSHLHGARRLVEAGLMNERPHVQFVMGVKNALPAEEHADRHSPGRAEARAPEGDLDRGRHRRHQAEVMGWALARGADAVRTGLEDNIRVAKDRLADEQRRARRPRGRGGRQGRPPVATPAEARRISAWRPAPRRGCLRSEPCPPPPKPAHRTARSGNRRPNSVAATNIAAS